MLIVRGSLLSNANPKGELEKTHVIVFDDVTNLIQAQRDAAWARLHDGWHMKSRTL